MYMDGKVKNVFQKVVHQVLKELFSLIDRPFFAHHVKKNKFNNKFIAILF